MPSVYWLWWLITQHPLGVNVAQTWLALSFSVQQRQMLWSAYNGCNVSSRCCMQRCLVVSFFMEQYVQVWSTPYSPFPQHWDDNSWVGNQHDGWIDGWVDSYFSMLNGWDKTVLSTASDITLYHVPYLPWTSQLHPSVVATKQEIPLKNSSKLWPETCCCLQWI